MRRIVALARVPGVSVAAVARRYGVNANQVFNWMRDPRFRAEEAGDGAATFLPVEVVADAPSRGRIDPRCGGVIEIVLANGHRLTVTAPFDPEAVALLARRVGGRSRFRPRRRFGWRAPLRPWRPLAAG